MDVISNWPLRVASVLWQSRPGAFAVMFVCKATYVLAPGTSPLAEVQDEPNLRDVYWNEDERQSLARAGDLVPFKRHVDVLLAGHAYAPGGRPVSSLLVRLVAGAVDKTIVVHGDRVLGRDDQISEAVPFARAPLRWERAAGGPGTWNPVGMRLDGPPDVRGAVPVANLLPPDLYVTGRRDVLPPVGFMPVAPGWPGRMEKLRHRAAGWDHRRWSEMPLPDDIDAGYFNAAPADQQVGEIRADERLMLENLHPEHPRLVTNLEAISLRAVAEVGGAPPHEVRLRCDTLSIDTDRGTAALVWRGNVRVAHPAQAGRVVVTMEPRGVPAGVPGLAAVHAKLGGTTGIDPAVIRGEALPFGQAAGAASALAQAPAAVAGVALPGLAAVHAKFGGTTGIDPAIVRRGEALPFASAASLPESPAPPPERDALPGLAAAHAKFGGTAGIDPGIMLRAALPFGEAAGAPIAPKAPVAWVEPSPPMSPPASSLFTLGQRVPEPPPPATPGDISVTHAPPPMIGPLATPEMVATTPPRAPDPAPALPVAAPEPVAPAEPPLPLATYPLERCAAITASIARRKAERAAILERHELTAELWEKLDRHWAETIQKDLGRGRAGLLSAHDEAYMAQIEAERGAITVEEYARLLVSAERGMEQETLLELDLPRGALLRVKRVWLKRTAASAALGKRIRAAVAEAGDG